MNLYRAARIRLPWRARLALRRGLAVEIGDDARCVLEASAGAFLRAGGVLSLADWARLDANERAALVLASRVIRAEQAVASGVASQSLAGALEVYSEVDAGAAKEEALLTLACMEAGQTERSAPR